MSVISIYYIILVLICLLTIQLMSQEYKNTILLFFSLFFLLTLGLKQFVFTTVYVSFVYFLNKAIKNKTKLTICIIACLIPLFVSKYFSNRLFGLLPIIGISFTTFRCISFTVDRYKKEIEQTNYTDYLLYTLFFPSFIAGPIEQYNLFLDRIQKEKVSWKNFVGGLITLLYGYALKMIIADRLIGIINSIYASPEMYTRYLVFAILSYPIYIYCDFAGYSYISLGTGRLLGVELTTNFKQPYLSFSVREFWNRWHISLNSWFKKYIYYPLGGNKKGTIKKYLNILIVFFLSGMWHGNTLGFILWGVLNGVYQIIGDLTFGARERIYEKIGFKNTFIYKFIKISFTYLLISVTWVLFSQDVDGTISILKNIFEYRKIGLMDFAFSVCAQAQSSIIEIMIIAGTCTIMAFVDLMENHGYCFSLEIPKKNVLYRYATVLILIILIVLFGKYGAGFDSGKFVYFNF